jgi:hypothetical protein
MIPCSSGFRAVVLGLAVLTLLSCSTLESGANGTLDFAVAHPVLTSVAAGVVGASIAAAASHHHRQDLVRRAEEPNPCARHPDICQQPQRRRDRVEFGQGGSHNAC